MQPKTLSEAIKSVNSYYHPDDNMSKTLGNTLNSGVLDRLSTITLSNNINYKYHEDEILNELKTYIDSTYSQHYSTNKYQATEFIIDGGHGEGFCIGNIMKYAQRYGKKNGKNKQDLLKVLHYAIIMLHIHNESERNVIK